MLEIFHFFELLVLGFLNAGDFIPEAQELFLMYTAVRVLLEVMFLYVERICKFIGQQSCS